MRPRPAAAILIILLGIIGWARPSASDQVTSFTPTLTSTAEALLHRVEKSYGAKVSFLEDPDQHEDIPAKFHISTSGKPSITINSKTGKNEESIVHELMHLQGIAQGVPWVNFHGDRYVDSQVVRVARDDLYDMIFHAYFYPRLRGLGYKPESQECDWLRRALEKRTPLPTASGSIQHASLALYYFRAGYLCRDAQLSDAFERILSTNGQSQSLAEGKAIVTIAQDNGLSRPHDVLDVFMASANALFAGQFKFSLAEVKPVRVGHIVEQTALIRIDPINLTSAPN